MAEIERDLLGRKQGDLLSNLKIGYYDPSPWIRYPQYAPAATTILEPRALGGSLQILDSQSVPLLGQAGDAP